jgi:uncharacterized delta-60 repeat protein
MAMKKIYMLLAAVLLMVMTGCGGGGDSSSAPSSAKAITAFSLNGIDGTINEAGKTIAVMMPPDTTDVTALVATFTTTGASIKVLSIVQTSGTTPNDFTNPVVYTVTAADATKQDYTVTVTVSSSFSGFLDKNFGTGGRVTTPVGSSDDYALALGIQSDGKIVVAGYSYNGKNYDFALVRYNIDGSLDDGTSNDSTPADQFGTGGKVITDFGSAADDYDDVAYALAIQSDGKIVVAGFSNNGSNYDFALVRYNTDGSLDDGFGAHGKVITDFGIGHDVAYALGIQSDGKIVVAGTSYNGKNFALVRYNTDGSLDDGTSNDSTPADQFGTGGKVITDFGSADDDYDDVAYALGIQSDDGKIVVAGYSNASGNNDFALVRYNSGGSLDTTFDTDGKVTTAVGSGLDTARALVIQADGQIVVAGTSNNGGKNNFALVRYNKTDGSLDTSFDTDGKVTTPVGSLDSAATALGIQSSDGKIVAAGISYDAFNSDFVLVRYNPDGSLDTDFYIGGIVTTSIGSGYDVASALDIQSADGKIVVAGYSYNVSATNYDFALVRYWP